MASVRDVVLQGDVRSYAGEQAATMAAARLDRLNEKRIFVLLVCEREATGGLEGGRG